MFRGQHPVGFGSICADFELVPLIAVRILQGVRFVDIEPDARVLPALNQVSSCRGSLVLASPLIRAYKFRLFITFAPDMHVDPTVDSTKRVKS